MILGPKRPLTKDLNTLRIPTDEAPRSLRRSSVTSNGIDVHFSDLDTRLIEHIQRADVVVGCVAWLTHAAILGALAEKQGVSIIVQKEDFLRPEPGAEPSKLHHLYAALRPLSRQSVPLLSDMSVCVDPTLAPVRCVGNHNSTRSYAAPRAHHKFALFCRLSRVDDATDAPQVIPYAVWTGSFNFTNNACASFENAVVIYDPQIVDAYFREYQQLAALSEPLDWSTPWCEPEWRIGT